MAYVMEIFIDFLEKYSVEYNRIAVSVLERYSKYNLHKGEFNEKNDFFKDNGYLISSRYVGGYASDGDFG